MFNRLEQVDDAIEARDHAIGYLVYSNVTSARGAVERHIQ